MQIYMYVHTRERDSRPGFDGVKIKLLLLLLLLRYSYICRLWSKCDPHERISRRLQRVLRHWLEQRHLSTIRSSRESDKGFTLKVELSHAVRSRLTVTAVVDEGDCLDFPATMVYTEGDQSAMLPYHKNPSFCDHTPGQCVFECDCSDTECVNIHLVILSAPDHSRKLCEIFIM